VIGMIFFARKHWRSGLVTLGVAVAWLWLCSTPNFSGWLANSLIAHYPARPAASYPQADAIVILGGGGLPEPIRAWDAKANPALDRPLGFGLALYRAGKSRTIVLSGEPGGGKTMARMLQQQGVPASAIHITATSLSTHKDALNARAFLEHTDGTKRILLVTFGLHMPRSAAAFKGEGIDSIPAPSFAHATADSGFWPDTTALHLSARALHEYFGLFYYRLRGWATW
jgi:uncharacterized SAM-binding protein YcdF (DUF218 family)